MKNGSLHPIRQSSYHGFPVSIFPLDGSTQHSTRLGIGASSKNRAFYRTMTLYAFQPFYSLLPFNPTDRRSFEAIPELLAVRRASYALPPTRFMNASDSVKRRSKTMGNELVSRNFVIHRLLILLFRFGY